MDGQVYIEELYAFVVMDDDGTEGVPAYRAHELMMPLMGADMARISSLRAIAQTMADEGKPVTLVRFTQREVVQVLLPRSSE